MMRNLRTYYSSTITDFLRRPSAEILGVIHSNDISADTRIQQSNTWEIEVDILKEQLRDFADGRIIFEYTIPRMGKRVDTVVLYRNIVFLLEFKCGDTEYRASTYDQVYDYALDLRNFQKESHDKLLVPIMISTNAPGYKNTLVNHERIIEPIRCNDKNLGIAIRYIADQFNEPAFDYVAWENSEYLPTPTIVEAAQALYRGHNVHDITRSDAGAENLTFTTDEINNIIEYSKANQRKSICFVTGVPGAGKTLVGLNLAIQHSDPDNDEHAVFLSGNYPLVSVLQEALARDKVEQEWQKGNPVKKSEALRRTSAFIQIIHKYRDYYVGNDLIPPDRVVIFDEYEIIGLNLKSQLNQGFRGLVLFLLTLKIADKAIHRRQYAQNRNLSAERGAASLCSASTRHTLPTYISFRRSTELSACVDLHRVPLRHSTHVPVARAA